jgi:hypothetical protein
MACTSSLPFGKDPSSLLKLSTHPLIAYNGVMEKECQTLGTSSTYDDSIRRIVFKFQLCISFPCTVFRLKILVQAVICYVLSTTFSSLMSQTLPLDMLGGLAKANTWVAKPEGYKFLLIPPSRHARAYDMRTSSLMSMKHPIAVSMLGQKGHQTRALGSSLTRRPHVSLHAELWRSANQPLRE